MDLLQLFMPLVGSILGGWLVSHRLDKKKQIHEHYLNSQISEKIYMKLIQFWEQYIEQLFTILDDLFQNHVTSNILENERKLYSIRRKYIMYLNTKTNKELGDFELSLREIWSKNEYLKSVPVSDKRSEIVSNISEKYLILIDINKSKEEKIKSINEIIEEIKSIIWTTKRIEKITNTI